MYVITLLQYLGSEPHSSQWIGRDRINSKKAVFLLLLRLSQIKYVGRSLDFKYRRGYANDPSKRMLSTDTMTSTTGTFAWKTSNIQQERFAAVTFVLSTRRKGPIEQPCTVDSTNLKIEESLLDHLAELLTIRLEPRFITGTALRRTADGHIAVIVARNNRLNESKDDHFLKEAEKWMQSGESPEKGRTLIPARAAEFNTCVRQRLPGRNPFLLQSPYRGGRARCQANRGAA